MVIAGKFLKKFLGLILLSSIGGAVLFFPQLGSANDEISLSKKDTEALLNQIPLCIGEECVTEEATGMASRRTILFEGTLDRIF